MLRDDYDGKEPPWDRFGQTASSKALKANEDAEYHSKFGNLVGGPERNRK
jgi:hypothetical protein